MYQKVTGNFSFLENDEKIMKFWEEKEILKKSAQKSGENFTLYDGPPTANGKPHIGHILTRVFKDVIARYKIMRGYKVFKKIGWDTHGLPVELETEKKLKLNGKPEIEEYGIELFIKECKKSVFEYKKDWEYIIKRIGHFVDTKDSYITCNNNYIESVWWAIKEIWNKNLLYKGSKVLPYCSRCGTTLSSHELAQGYKNVMEESVVVKFKVKSKENEYFLAWTTTPWTLPSNVALVVNSEKSYSKIELENEKYILATDAINSVIKKDYKIIEDKVGYELAGIKYEPIFDYEKQYENIYFIVCDDYVDVNEGTGIVHLAPAFGEDDERIGIDNNLPTINLVNTQGKFIEKVIDFEGMFVKDADEKIIENLREKNLLFELIKFEHSYPFCWRCDTPLIYYSRDTWFIKMKKIRKKMIANNEKINWYPENIKNGRFGNFIENIVDWSLSRSRYWGTPIPIWVCKCGFYHCVGSINELKSMGKNVPENIELHKPYIDEIVLKCSECGNTMSRVPETIDCWFDSGCMPFAQFHYPFENKKKFEESFPGDFICEAIDQTRGWFYTMLAVSTLLFDEISYKNVMVLGHVLDKNGIKMSKHKGNVIDPVCLNDMHGADSIRWYFYSNTPWNPNCFDEKFVIEIKRKFLGTFWSAYSFFVLYANIDRFVPKENWNFDNVSLLDKWIISKLNTLIKKVSFFMDEYKVMQSSKIIEDFVDELSNWYIRCSRERFWSNGENFDKTCAYMTLYVTLVKFSKVCAPFIPFMTEQIYQNLVLTIDKNAIESVHLCDYPVFDKTFEYKDIEKNMDVAKKIVMLGRFLRNETDIKIRQPLASIYIKTPFELKKEYENIILEELNIKEIKFIDDLNKFVSYRIKPQLRTMGPKYGKKLKRIFECINEMDSQKIIKKIEDGERFSFNFENETIEIKKDDIIVETFKKDNNLFLKSDGEIVIVIDTNLTEELIEEGCVREIISRIQNLRKTYGFEVQDYIKIEYKTFDLEEILNKNISEISRRTLCKSIEKSDEEDGFFEFNFNYKKIKIRLSKFDNI
ncbi:MAG: isoleucine--tRNA ligase [Clostridiales bacterium]|jgi:isoleucyl-tRNA synthetase|nr:isoleucine--tRNA ligase [Clostridiales bacterium]